MDGCWSEEGETLGSAESFGQKAGAVSVEGATYLILHTKIILWPWWRMCVCGDDIIMITGIIGNWSAIA